MPTVLAAVNQRAQIGPETTPGTTVAATKILEAISIVPAIKSSNKDHRAQGRKHPAVVTQGKELTEFKWSGEADFNELVYPMSSVFGPATITTPGGGTNSRQWLFAPPLSGATGPKTFTFEVGSSTRAGSFGYGLFTGLGLKFTRDSVDASGDGMGQLYSDGITLTSSLSPVGLQPILGNQMNYYVDTASGSLGSTQISDVLEASFDFTGAFGPYWPQVRANSSFTSHVDLAPKVSAKMKVQADSSGMSYLTTLRSGAKQYIRFEAIGPVIESTIHYTMFIDLCATPSNVSAFEDSDGVWALEWDFTPVEDSSWGHAVLVTLINSLTAL